MKGRRPGRVYLAGAPLLIAHRGGSRLAPENTMVAFRQAVDTWGADMLEMDVHATRDGKVVVLHDATLERTTDGRGAVADMTWAEVSRVDAGYHFTDLGGQPSFRGVGVRVPLFEDVLTAFPRTRLNVESKAGAAARPLVDIIRRHGAERRVLVAAEQERDRLAIRSYPGPWGASAVQLRWFWLTYRLPVLRAITPRADALQIPDVWKGRVVTTPELVRSAHARNLPVHVWTVDDPQRMGELLDMGVDGIQTDRPDLLATVLHEVVGRPLPAGATTPS